MKVTVCELPDESGQLETAWDGLTTHVRSSGSQLVLLPEMPFHPWLAATDTVDEADWQAAVEAHESWMQRFGDLAPATVTGSRPVVSDGSRYNEGFVWEAGAGAAASHRKHYLPDEAGFWEASWYQRGGPDFQPVAAAGATAGYAICSELWFTEHARAYARAGVQLLLCPRATRRASLDKWITGGRVAAMMAGAFCLSSNRGGDGGGVAWGGTGWVISPDGEVLGTTSADQPCLTLELDLAAADSAKHTYPRSVRE